MLRSSAPHDLEAQARTALQLQDDENLERSAFSPDRSAGQELLSQGQESSNFEDISRVATTLYEEMKKSIGTRNLNTFREAIAVAKEIVKRGGPRRN